MSLTIHLNASDTDKLFTSFDSGGAHTGTPSDGNAVVVWDDETGSIADVAFIDPTTTTGPAFRSGGSALMLNSCLDLDGSARFYAAYAQDGSPVKALSAFISAAAWTAIFAIYPDAITLTDATVYNNHCLIGDTNQFWGIYLKDVSGVKHAFLYNYDGAIKTVDLTIGTGASYVIMWRYDGTNMYGSVNGGSEVGPTASGNTTDVSFAFQMGRSTGSTYYDGRIGEAKIWNTNNADGALASEISAFTTKWLGSSVQFPEVYDAVLHKYYRRRYVPVPY